MPNTTNFGGQQIVEPGVHSQILGQIPSPAITASFANIFLIDTGSQGKGIGATLQSFGGGSGINGQLQANGNAIYKFTDPFTFKSFVKGGLLWDLADYLFTPSFSGRGPATVYHARAAATTAPQFTFTLPTAAGSLVINCINEGLNANGVLLSGVVTRGYGCKIKAGIFNVNAYIIEFYEGQFKGIGADGNPYDGIVESAVTQSIVAKSIEFTTAAQFIAWAASDQSFAQYFSLDPTTVTSAVAINVAVLTTYAAVQLFAGGTTSYSLAALQAVLDNITDYDNSAFLCDDYGITPAPSGGDITGGCNKGGLSTFNQAILTHVISQANYTQKQLYIGGGQDSTQYSNGTDGTKDQAIFYNTALVISVHSAVKVPATLGGLGLAYKYNSSLYSAALGCGRIAGLQPQTPGTYKDVRIIGLKHEFKKSERVDALQHGVFHYRNVPTLGWVINQSINSKQNNASIIYNDGTSPEISIMRIIHQLNKELVLNGVQFVGGNLNTVAPSDLINFTNSYLLARTAEPLADNLILAGPHKVTVTYSNGVYNIRYCVIPNSPVNIILFTGFLLDSSVSTANQGS
jgi:hypothetical protein